MRAVATLGGADGAFTAKLGAPTVLVTAVGEAEGSRGAAAALACAGAAPDQATLLVDVGGRTPRPTLLASDATRRLEERLVAHLPTARVAARGQVCHLAVPAEEDGLELAAAAVTVNRGALAVVHLEPAGLRLLLDVGPGPQPTGVLLRADIGADRPLLALAVRELLERDLDVAVLKRRLGWVAERRAHFGALSPEQAGVLPPAVRKLLQTKDCYPEADGFGADRKGRTERAGTGTR